MAEVASLAGLKAVVTGASRGIGQAIAARLDQAGAKLALVQRGDATETLAALGHEALVERADLSAAEDAEAAVERAIDRLGGVDICVCNAAGIARESVFETSIETFRSVVELNLVSTFAAARACARRMERGGSIVLIGSVLSFQGGLRVPSYAVSKAGVANLARALANEWAPLGIRVNAVAPGYIENEQTAPVRADPVRAQQITDRIPAGFWGRDEDVAEAVAWLASPASGYVHGHVLVVDGGWMGR